MAEAGREVLEKLVEAGHSRRTTLIAAVLAVLVASVLGREAIEWIAKGFESNYGYDAQLRATQVNRTLATGTLPVTFVDVDESALDAWSDATRTTPRNKIADLIKTASARKPALIFVDFDLSGALRGDGDAQLTQVLSDYPANAPPLLVTRTTRPLNCGEEGCAPNICATDRASGVASSPFEAAVAGKPNIIWVANLFGADGDGVVRKWRLWEPLCSGGKLVALPSPQLAAAALADKSPAGRAALDRYLEHVAGNSAAAVGWPRNTEGRFALIPFLIGGSTADKVSDWRGDAGFGYQRVSALSVDGANVADSAIAGRVLILGASYGGDRFDTPFGNMPGAALIANAVAVAPSILNTKPTSPALLLSFSLILAAVYAVAARLLRVLPAGLLILAISYAWLTLATYCLNPADAVQTVSYALVLLAAFLAIEGAIEIADDLYERGYIALLRKPKKKAAAAVEEGHPSP